jgi:hypothetical protein
VHELSSKCIRIPSVVRNFQPDGMIVRFRRGPAGNAVGLDTSRAFS